MNLLDKILLEDPWFNKKIKNNIKMLLKKKKIQSLFHKMNSENFEQKLMTYFIIILKEIIKGKMNKKY